MGKAECQAAPDIEKGTRKVKAQEDTEKTAEAAARSHARGCTGKAKNTQGGSSSSSGRKRAPTDGCDAGVGGARRGGAKQREDDCEERGVKDSDCEQTGRKRKCEELVNEHVREKIKRYKTMTDRGEGRIGKQLDIQVQEKPWRRARKRDRQNGEESDGGTSGSERPRVKKETNSAKES
jgi:hypothetical protein